MSAAGEADITLVAGSSGSGKSAFVKRAIAGRKRVIAWDPTDEYSAAGFVRCYSLTDLVARLKRAERARIAYVAREMADFDLWCRIAYRWGNCTVVAEELADVTSPGKAPPGWGRVLRRGRHRGLSVFGITQRPCESDKTIVGNRTAVHICRLERVADRAYMARETGLTLEQVSELRPPPALDYIHVERGKVESGSLKFPPKTGQKPLKGAIPKSQKRGEYAPLKPA